MKKAKYRRILLKLSGEVLRDSKTGECLSDAVLADMAAQIRAVCKLGVQVGVVIGGGNIFRGAAASAGGAIAQAQADSMGMLATIINALALQEAMERAGMRTSVMTSIAMQNVAEPFVRRQALSHLSEKRVCIFAGGTGNPFFSTDTAAALRALEIGAEAILKGTKVDGVYSADPVKDPKAVRYDKLSYLEVLKQQLKVMDATAISMCMDHNLPVVVFNLFVPGNLAKVVTGANLGTVVYG